MITPGAVICACLINGALCAGEISSPKTEIEKKEPSQLSFWDGRVVFDIEERVRGEIRENNRDFGASIQNDNDDAWLLNRFRVGLALKPISWFKFYAQTQDSREAFSDRANIPGVRSAEGDDILRDRPHRDLGGDE